MAEEITFNVNVDAGNSAESVNVVNEELQETERLTEEIGGGKGPFGGVGQGAEEAAKAIKKPTTRLRELTDQMAMLSDQGGPEFQALAREAGTLQDQINNARAATNAMANDFPALQVGVQAMQGIGAAAQGATAAQALLGSENEDVAKSIQKMMAIQALMNSVQQIANVLSDESALGLKLRAFRTSVLTAATNAQTAATGAQTIAQRALNFVMNANPVFLLITGFVALTAAIAVFATSTEDARTQQELLNEAQDAAVESIGEETAKLDDLVSVLNSETASRNQKREAIEELNKAYPEFLGNIDLEKATQEELNVAIAKQTELITLQAEAKALASIRADLFKEKLELEMEAQRALTDESIRWEDAIGAGTTARLKDDLARQQRIATIDEEINATKAATDANRDEEASLLGVVDAQKLAMGLADAFTKQQEATAKDVNKAAKEADARRKKASADRAKEADQEAKTAVEREKVLQDLLIANQEDADLRKLMALEASQERERAATIAKYGEDTALIKELETQQAMEVAALISEIEEEAREKNAEKREEERERENADSLARLQAQLLKLDEDSNALFEKRQELAQLERDQELENKELTEGEKLLIEADFLAKSAQIKDESQQRDKERNKQAADAATKTFEQGLSSIKNLSDAVFAIKKNNLEKGSAAELKAAKKQFEVNKALQLSSAIIDGVKAISASLAQAPIAIGPAPNPAGIASLAFAGVTAAANIAKIAASKFQGGGSAGATVGAPSVPAIATPDTSVNTSAIGDGDTTLTGGGTDGQGTTQAAPMRVAVVDSDIKVALDNSERVEVTSSIG